MKKPKIIYTVLGLLVLVGGLATGTILVQQRQNLSKKAAPATTMYVTPATQTVAPGDTFTYDVQVDTAENAMTGFDIRMAFDPNVIQITSLTKGTQVSDFTTAVTDTFDNTGGTIAFSYVTTDVTKAVSGTGVTVLTVSASVKASATAGSYDLAFDPSTMAIATNETQNILISKTKGTVTVSTSNQGEESPSPEPTPTDSGEIGASPSPTSSPNSEPTPTPTSGTTGTTGTTTNVTVSAPANNSTTSDSTPTFKGTAKAGTSVSITIQSNPITATVTADANGNWSYTPTQTLADGSHTVSITAQDSGGTTKTVSSSFTVSTAAASSTPPQLPETGTSWPTYAGAALGVFVIAASLLLAL